MTSLYKWLFHISLFSLVLLSFDLIRSLLEEGSISISLFILYGSILILFLITLNKYWLPFNRKTKLLRQQPWFQDFLQKNGTLFIFNLAVQKLIEQTNIEEILKDQQKTQEFQTKFQQIIDKEGA